MRFLSTHLAKKQPQQLRAAPRLVAHVGVGEADHPPAQRHQTRLAALPVDELPLRHPLPGSPLVESINLDGDPHTGAFLDHEIAIPRAPAVVDERDLRPQRRDIELGQPGQHVRNEQHLVRAVRQQMPILGKPGFKIQLGSLLVLVAPD